MYVESGTNCFAKANKDFEFSSWVQNLPHNSTITLNTTEISDSPWNSFLRLIDREPNDPSVTFDVNAYGSYTAHFKPLPPAVPAEYWIPLYGVIVSSIVGWSIPSIVGWVRAKRQGGKAYHYYKRINYLNSNSRLEENEITDLYKLERDITYGYTKGKINEQHYSNLKSEISVLYEEIYKKKIDSLTGNEIRLNKLREDEDAYAKGKISEQHYKLLIGKISDNKSKQGSADKLPSAQGASK